jgi:hypothetical protein
MGVPGRGAADLGDRHHAQGVVDAPVPGSGKLVADLTSARSRLALFL